MKKQRGYCGPGVGQLVILAATIMLFGLTVVEALVVWAPAFGW